MKGLFMHNIGWKLLSIAGAVLLWISVAREPELATAVSAPVEYKNLPPQMDISSNIPESVVLEVRGPSAELQGVPGARPRYAVVLDMTGIQPGEHTFPIDSADVRLPRGIHLLRAIPAQVRLNFEPDEKRPVPVQVRLAGNLPPDLRVLSATPNPATLMIAGPASHVAGIPSVQTDPIQLKPEPGTAEYRLQAYIDDSHVHFQGPPQVKVIVTIEKQ